MKETEKMLRRIAYLDCSAGITGQMFLGALLDAGFALESLQASLALVSLPVHQLQVQTFADRGIHGMQLVLTAPDSVEASNPTAIADLLARSTLPTHVRERSQAVLDLLFDARLHVYGSSDPSLPDLNLLTTLIEIVGVIVGLETLGITHLYSSALPLTSGHVQKPSGLVPVPDPVVLELASRVSAPWQPCVLGAANLELVTPLGAALLASLAQFSTPAMIFERVGNGFSTQVQTSWPAALRLCLGKTQEAGAEGIEGVETDWVTVIETHIDNMSGELLGGLMERLLTLGAYDVGYQPLQMKKNRPATHITVISPPEKGEYLAALLLRETSTLGVRIQQVQRRKARRTQERITTPLGPMLVKVKRLGERIISATPEYEECQRVAHEQNIPLIDVYELVRQAIHRAFP